MNRSRYIVYDDISQGANVGRNADQWRRIARTTRGDWCASGEQHGARSNPSTPHFKLTDCCADNIRTNLARSTPSLVNTRRKSRIRLFEILSRRLTWGGRVGSGGTAEATATTMTLTSGFARRAAAETIEDNAHRPAGCATDHPGHTESRGRAQ